jgi:hypothetical protein
MICPPPRILHGSGSAAVPAYPILPSCFPRARNRLFGDADELVPSFTGSFPGVRISAMGCIFSALPSIVTAGKFARRFSRIRSYAGA